MGCGPGSFTLLLATKFAQVTGIDADADMLEEANRLGARAGATNVEWVHLRAEDLPAGLGTFRTVSFAQSFHWLDRPRVAEAVHGLLEEGGVCLHVHATTHEGIDTDLALPHPQPPRGAMTRLVQRYLGPVRRAGQGYLADGPPSGEADVYRAAGFTGPRRIEVPGPLVTRTVDDLVAGVFSVSSSAPHLFGNRRAAFEAELRQLLLDADPAGTFTEQMRPTAVDIWRV